MKDIRQLLSVGAVLAMGFILFTADFAAIESAVERFGLRSEMRLRAIWGDLRKTPDRRTREAYEAMKWRCVILRRRDVTLPGGKPIEVCPEWLVSFEAFRADMGDAPRGKSVVERIDQTKGYEPGNCRWGVRP